YKYRESRITELQKILVSFRNAFPSMANSQIPELKVLVSTDFNNTYSYENLMNATWHDITPGFTYATSGSYIESGDYDISPWYEEGKPLYFAFRYTSQPQVEHGPVRDFAIQSVQFMGDDIYTLEDMESTNFRLVEKSESEVTSSVITATTIRFEGYVRTLPTDPDPATDTWAVSKALDLPTTIDSGPDRAVAIKGNKDPILRNHIHVFTE